MLGFVRTNANSSYAIRTLRSGPGRANRCQLAMQCEVDGVHLPLFVAVGASNSRHLHQRRLLSQRSSRFKEGGPPSRVIVTTGLRIAGYVFDTVGVAQMQSIRIVRGRWTARDLPPAFTDLHHGIPPGTGMASTPNALPGAGGIAWGIVSSCITISGCGTSNPRKKNRIRRMRWPKIEQSPARHSRGTFRDPS